MGKFSGENLDCVHSEFLMTDEKGNDIYQCCYYEIEEDLKLCDIDNCVNKIIFEDFNGTEEL
jgi:hypothetical protein